MSDVTYIYGLFDKRAPDRIMYVGKSNDPKFRLKQHLRKPTSRRMRTWLISARVGMRILQEVPTELWHAHEAWWVAHWRALNPDLLNVMPGGQEQGCVGRVAENLTGQKFGRWLVKDRGTRKGRRASWLCQCDCGTLREVWSCDLVRNKNFSGSKSCGCLSAEKASERMCTRMRVDGNRIRAAGLAARREHRKPKAPLKGPADKAVLSAKCKANWQDDEYRKKTLEAQKLGRLRAQLLRQS